MKKLIIILFPFIVLSSCGDKLNKEPIIGCWTVAYIDTDGVNAKAGDYQMCFEENDQFYSQRTDGKQKVKAEWILNEDDSTIIMHYEGKSISDTMRIKKLDEDDLHLQLKKRYSTITIYLRKRK